MAIGGFAIKLQVSSLPVQLGTMIGFARAGRGAVLSYAWDGVQSRIWNEVEEPERNGVVFPRQGSPASAYADFRDTVIARSRRYMDMRIDEAHAELREFGKFEQIGVREPLRFARQLIEARDLGIVSESAALTMLASAAKLFEEEGLDVVMARTKSGINRKLVGGLAGVAGVASLAIGSYMLSVSAPGIALVVLGIAAITYGASRLLENRARQEEPPVDDM
ncbi:MAG: hypothetical protein WC683_19630 [bacterium]